MRSSAELPDQKPEIGYATQYGNARTIAPGVLWLPMYPGHGYLAGESGGPWAVVDTGIPGQSERIISAAKAQFGKDSRPEGVYLTHGHYDHAGSALALAAYWDVPIYIHKMELPYVTGKAVYPPIDPTVGGPIGLVSYVAKHWPLDLRDYVRPLPETGALPGMTGWEVVPTPGHAPGHVSYFRKRDRVLLAGDALMTVRLDHLWDALRRPHQLAPPPPASTIDWIMARKSLQRLAELQPRTIGAGHGIPLSDNNLPMSLESMAIHFNPPFSGRYICEPALTDENGVTYIPPKTADPLPKIVAILGVAAIASLYYLRKKRNS